MTPRFPLRRPIRVRRMTARTALVLLSVVVAGVTPAQAATGRGTSPTHDALLAPAGDGSSDILEELSGVPVDGPLYRSALAAYDDVVARRAAAIARHDEAVATLVTLRARADVLDELIARDERVKSKADAAAERLAARLRHLALQAYVGTTDGETIAAELDLDLDRVLAGKVRTDLSAAVAEGSYDDLAVEQSVSRAAAKRLASNRGERADVAAGIARNIEIRTESTQETERTTVERGRRRIALEDARALSMVVGTNLPLVALDAYVRGATLANERRPGCDMNWALLAGIGQIESHQGTYGGAQLDSRGQVSRPIHGIELDGSGGNERIEVAGGFMRAEGPMQFLPSTWNAVAVDGNDDGIRDPQNLYDAAASAAAYLCRRGVSVSTDGGRTAAVLTYNNSRAYVADVVREAERYASALPEFPEPRPADD